jgi:CRISPR/Cas system-associated exonuclease Cas4 (RecB family)
LASKTLLKRGLLITTELFSFQESDNEKAFLEIFGSILDEDKLDDEVVLQFKQKNLVIESRIGRSHSLKAKFPPKVFGAVTEKNQNIKLDREKLKNRLEGIDKVRKEGNLLSISRSKGKLEIDYHDAIEPLKFSEYSIQNKNELHRYPVKTLNETAEEVDPEQLRKNLDALKSKMGGDVLSLIMDDQKIGISFKDEDDITTGYLPPVDAKTSVKNSYQTTFLTQVVNPLLNFLKKDPEEIEMYTEPKDESMTEFNFSFEKGVTVRIMLAPKEMGAK